MTTTTLPTPGATLRFRATNVVATRTLPVEVQADLPARAVAKSLASLMGLPDNVPWALRADSTAYLAEDSSIGSQVETDALLTVTPRTHLGAQASPA
jgi:hypothetical protein